MTIKSREWMQVLWKSELSLPEVSGHGVPRLTCQAWVDKKEENGEPGRHHTLPRLSNVPRLGPTQSSDWSSESFSAEIVSASGVLT